MCKKRIRIDKYNALAKIMTNRSSQFLLFFILMVSVSCTGKEPVFTNDVVLNEYPDLAESITFRDASGLLKFTDHPQVEVRNLIWRALAKSTINNPDSLVEIVISANEHAAWLGLSTHDLSDNSVRKLHDIFTAEPNKYMQACEIFKRQGREQDLMLILRELPGLQDPGLCSAAAGGILANINVSEAAINAVLDVLVDAGRPDVRRNLLYGMYRSPLNRPAGGSDAWNRLRDGWVDLGVGQEPATDQYMIGILGSEGAKLFVEHVSFPEGVSDHPLIIEVIRAMELNESSMVMYQPVVMDALSHGNPTVATEMLERLKNLDSLDARLTDHIYYDHVKLGRNAVIFVTAFELLQGHGLDLSPMEKKLEFIYRNNPYLTNRVLSIYREFEPADSFLNRIWQGLNAGGVRGLHAAQALTDYWIGLDDEGKSGEIRQIVFDAAEVGHPSVLSGLSTLLTDDNLMRDSDFGWLEARYEESLNSDSRVATETLMQALEARFPDRHGELVELDDVPFKIPDWERLNEMGIRPYWHLDTEKGEVVIRLDPLSAPFTVSSIDSLTRAGAYDSVAFHRVVHNFVIQGGDVGRGDGFGGPGYRIPTEPSIKSFERGAVGIASSGTDTEGSQYFVIHQWKPHLDADYTLFGTVVRGMDVVDRIQVGDLVVKASISVN